MKYIASRLFVSPKRITVITLVLSIETKRYPRNVRNRFNIAVSIKLDSYVTLKFENDYFCLN